MNREQRRYFERMYPGGENTRSHTGPDGVEAEFDLWLARQPDRCACGTAIELMQWETAVDLRTSPFCSKCGEWRGDIFVVTAVR